MKSSRKALLLGLYCCQRRYRARRSRWREWSSMLTLRRRRFASRKCRRRARAIVWAPGYWEWRGGQHVWVGGRWMGERRGYHWVPDRWEQRGPHWHHYAGHWER
jgi:hypothetical protein